MCHPERSEGHQRNLYVHRGREPLAFLFQCSASFYASHDCPTHAGPATLARVLPLPLKYHLRQRLFRRMRDAHRNILHSQSIRNLLRFAL